MNVKNYLKISARIASSGQPSADEFRDIALDGYHAVINLAMASSDNAVQGESGIVLGLGMIYVHLPVEWESPKREQFEVFCAVMEGLKPGKVWVHCAFNMWVSAFIYLYRIVRLDIPENVALRSLTQIWQPNRVWQNFIAGIRG